MTQQYKHKKILIIQGPNMNLLGHRFKDTKTKITLDKLNAHLRKTAKKHKIKLIILQTNEESKATTTLQRQRNKICSTLLFPGPWQQSGFVLKDTLELLKIPYITISLGENVTLLKGIDNIEGDILKACETALEQLTQLIELH